jgi:hypothetical protein
MRKILIIGLLIAILSGCAQKPEQVLVDYLKLMKSSTIEALSDENQSSYFTERTPFNEYDLTDGNDSEQSEYTKKFADEMLQLFQSFDYKINSTKLADDNHATINVQITTYPLATMVSQVMFQALGVALSGGLSNTEESDKYFYDSFVTTKESSTKDYIKSVDVFMTKIDNKWLLVGGNKNTALINAIMGGLMDYSESLNQTANQTNSGMLVEARGLNQSVIQSGIEFVALNVRISKGNDYMKPSEGNEYIVIDINLKNQNANAFGVSSMMNFELKDKDGRTMNQNYFVDLNGSLDGTIYQNEQMTGEIAYEVPSDDSELYLYFKTDYFQNNAIKLKIR